MRKYFILIIGLTVFSCAASAQAYRYTSVIANSGLLNVDNGYHCPVANFNLTYSVAAIKYNATITAFCLINHDFMSYPPLPVIPVFAPYVYTDIAYFNFGQYANDFTIIV